tara:strand:- start:650 stop:2407 length:1758 start_codon:yes stop_codon:yes gene_type:complete
MNTQYPKKEIVLNDKIEVIWDEIIEMSDGTKLRCDIFRPNDKNKYPVIITYGPYGKWLHFSQLYSEQWERMCDDHPDVPKGSSNLYQNWEVVDPEKWITNGYIVIRVDSRGAGRSEGVMDLWSYQESKDFSECIEWAAQLDYSTGKVGINGISYYGMNQWQVASLQPKSLTAMCVWEGAADYYRELGHHGGIYCSFTEAWFQKQILTVQNGKGENGILGDIKGDWVSGPKTLTESQLKNNRFNLPEQILSNKLATDEFWTSRMPDFSKINVPLLSSANWGGQGLHSRGNFDGFTRSASKDKWLEVHGIEHWTEFYTDYGVNIQKQFFDYFLKEIDNGWKDRPSINLLTRYPNEVFKENYYSSWPLENTSWKKVYLNAYNQSLSKNNSPDSKVTYRGFSDGITFLMDPLTEEAEITGPMSLKIFISTDTTDTDIFVVLRLFDEELKEVTFQGAIDPHTPISQGWLRASHRKLDKKLSKDYQPYHSHDKEEALKPGEIYELDVEVWPTSIVMPKNHRLALSIRGKDYAWPGGKVKGLGNLDDVFTGVGPFKHENETDRPASIYDGNIIIYTGDKYPSNILLPYIEKK